MIRTGPSGMCLRLVSATLATIVLLTCMPGIAPAGSPSDLQLPAGGIRIQPAPAQSGTVNSLGQALGSLFTEAPSAELVPAGGTEAMPRGDADSGWTYDILVSDQGWNARNDGFQSMEMDPGNENELYIIYESWTDFQSPGTFQGYLVLRRSTDGGGTWSPEIWTFRYPTMINGQYPDMKEPDIAIGNDGRIWLTYTVFAYDAARNVLDMQIFCQYMYASAWGAGPWTGVMVSGSFDPYYHYHRLPTICVQESTNLPYITTLTYDYISATLTSLVTWQYVGSPSASPWDGWLVVDQEDANYIQHPCMDSGSSSLYITFMYYYEAGGVFDMVVYRSTNSGQDWTMVGDFYDDANINSFYKPSIASTKSGTDYIVCAGTYLSDPNSAHLGQIGYAYSLNGGGAWDGYIMSMSNYQRMPYVQECEKDAFLMSYRQEDGGEQYSTRVLYAEVSDLSYWEECGIASDTGSFQAANWFAHVVMQYRPYGDFIALSWSDLRDAAAPITENSQTHVVFSTEGQRLFLDTVPTGLNIRVDSLITGTPTYFNWPAGYEHEMEAISPQASGPSTYFWDSWSNAMLQTDSVISSTWDFSLTANYLAGEHVSIPLHQGWNLVSVPLEQSDKQVASVLASISGSWDRVYYYNSTYAQCWLSNTVTMPDPSDTLQTIDRKMGFWVNVTSVGGATLELDGSWPASTTMSLRTGWNLVGYPSQTPRLASATLPAQADYVSVFSATDSYIEDYSDLSLVTMSYGNGYWVRVTGDCTWTVQP